MQCMPSFHAHVMLSVDAIEDCRHSNIVASIQCGSVTKKFREGSSICIHASYANSTEDSIISSTALLF